MNYLLKNRLVVFLNNFHQRDCDWDFEVDEEEENLFHALGFQFGNKEYVVSILLLCTYVPITEVYKMK